MTTAEKLLRILTGREGAWVRANGAHNESCSIGWKSCSFGDVSIEDAVRRAYDAAFPAYNPQKGDIGFIRSCRTGESMGLGVFDGTVWRWGSGEVVAPAFQRPKSVLARMLTEPIELES